MKAKVNKIVGIKEWTGEHGTFYFHALLMDNEDKLNIGKKVNNAFTVGQEIEYEYKGEPDEKGWVKAKQVTGFNKGGFKKEPFEERAITMALSYAKDMGIAKNASAKDVLKIADVFYEWMLSKQK